MAETISKSKIDLFLSAKKILYEMKKIEYSHRTSSGNIYPLEIGWNSISTSDIPFDKGLTDKACRLGCKLHGRNGGCPPFSPYFRDLSVNFSKAIAIYAKIQTNHYPPKVINGNYFVRWSFAEALLSPFVNRFKKITEHGNDLMFLSSGHCKGCKNKRCAAKEGKLCRDTLRRTFSLESTGVIVTKMSEIFLGFKLDWWDPNNPDYIPLYMIKVVAILTNNLINDSDIYAVFSK